MPPLRLAILGLGSMASAILQPLLEQTTPFSADAITATTRSEESAQKARKQFPKIKVITDNKIACEGADVVLIAVKPYMIKEVVETLDLSGKVVISVAAGVTLASLQEWMPRARILRTMPNTPCRVQKGVVIITPVLHADRAHEHYVATSMFENMAKIVWLEERLIDAATAVAGSGPAFALMMIESMADGGVMMGLRRDIALELAAHTVLGSAQLQITSHQHPAALRDEITTPAGCTIAGLQRLEQGNFRSVVSQCIQETTKVAKGMA